MDGYCEGIEVEMKGEIGKGKINRGNRGERKQRQVKVWLGEEIHTDAPYGG